MIRKGAHINAVGAIVPSRAELSQDLLARCTTVVVDNISQAQTLSKELTEFFGPAEREEWKRVNSLAALLAAGRVRDVGDDITLFKSLGMGIADLALGIEIYRKSITHGLGKRLPRFQRAPPRLRACTE